MELREFREVLEAGWQMLDDAVAGMGEAELMAPGVVEEWSAKDLLGHVAAWEHQALGLLRQRAAGEPLSAVSGAGVDSYNEAESRRRAALTLDEVRAELAETRRELRERLAALPEEDWAAVVDAERGATFGGWVGGVTGGPLGPGTHPAEHAHHILLARVIRNAKG